jgi:hypothetical protein
MIYPVLSVFIYYIGRIFCEVQEYSVILSGEVASLQEQPPVLESQGIPVCLALSSPPVQQGRPTSSYGIAERSKYCLPLYISVPVTNHCVRNHYSKLEYRNSDSEPLRFKKLRDRYPSFDFPWEMEYFSRPPRYFTKWPEAYAIPNQEAATVAEALVTNFFCRFGVPRELHSDQGRNF